MYVEIGMQAVILPFSSLCPDLEQRHYLTLLVFQRMPKQAAEPRVRQQPLLYVGLIVSTAAICFVFFQP